MMEEGFRSLTEGVNFVQQILTSSSIESGTFTYDMKPMDMKALVLEVAEKQKARAIEKKLSYEVNVEEAGSYNITGDAAQLKEAVNNLIDNSILYTKTGSIKINLSNKNNKILLSINDTGIGISEEDKPRLFTKGGKGRDSLKVNVNSSGYGLAFVKGVVEAHGGSVSASSPGPGLGSTFSIELPRK